MTRGEDSTKAAGPDEGTVYLLHFEKPYKQARHYTGWTSDLDARLEDHRKGRGARLMEVIKEAGIGFRVTRTWPGTRGLERAIKDRHEAPRLCPECTPQPKPVSTGRSAAGSPDRKQAESPPRQQLPSPARVAEQPVPAEKQVAGQAPLFERGAAQARLLIGRQIDAGFSVDQIESINAQMFRDYDPATANPRTLERHRGYQTAAAELIAAQRQVHQPQVEEHEAELEVG